MLTTDRNGTAHGPSQESGMKASGGLGTNVLSLLAQVSAWRRTLRGLLEPARAEMEAARTDFAALGKEVDDMQQELETMAARAASEMKALGDALCGARVECDLASQGEVFVPAVLGDLPGYGEPEMKAGVRPEVAQAMENGQIGRLLPTADGLAAMAVESGMTEENAADYVRQVSDAVALPVSGRWPDGDTVTPEQEAAIQRLEARGVYPPSGAAAWDAIRAEIDRAAAPAPEIDGQGDPRVEFKLPAVAGPAKAGEDYGQAVVQALGAVAREQAQRPKPKKQPRKGGRK